MSLALVLCVPTVLQGTASHRTRWPAGTKTDAGPKAKAKAGPGANGAAPGGPPSDRPVVDRAGFSLKFKDVISDFNVLALFVLPGEAVDLEIARPVGEQEKQGFKLLSGAAEIPPLAPGHWSWIAPSDKGLYSVTVVPPDGSPGMSLNVFVMVPFASLRDGKINGYRIGVYPGHPKNDRAAYLLPRGFVEVTKDAEEVPVSPHFRLGQFLCKQESGYPKYLILNERLVLKLEWILEKVNAAGYRADTFFVMSGYRTPFYNASIGNVEFSMHQWGGAADIFIDESPRDGRMDDLNGDHVVDVKDAMVLQAIVERMETSELATPFTGGLGLYGNTSTHGPFIHVDVRAFRARW